MDRELTAIDSILQYGFFQGFLEALGKDSLNDVCGKESFSSILEKKKGKFLDPFSPHFFEFFDQRLKQKYSEVSSEGIARCAGRFAFKIYKDELQVFVEGGLLENRLLPFDEKMDRTLRNFLQELNIAEFGELNLPAQEKEDCWRIYGKLLFPKGFVLQVGNQQFLIGVLESMLDWIDSRFSYHVAQQGTHADIASGKIDLLISLKAAA